MYLAETVESALGQNFRDFELVVSDNASTDGTERIVANFRDPRIRYERSAKNIGPVGNFNRCIDLARGEYIKMLCADDLIYPDCLSRQVAVMDMDEKKNLSMISCPRDIIDERSRIRLRPRTPGLSGRIRAAEAVHACVVSGTNIFGEPPAVLFRKNQAVKVGGFNPAYGFCLDLDFWFRLLEEGDLYRMDESLCAFRVSPNSWSSGLSGKQAAEYRRFLFDVKSAGRFGISDEDVRRSIQRAQMNDRLRRIFYLWLSFTDFLRFKRY